MSNGVARDKSLNLADTWTHFLGGYSERASICLTYYTERHGTPARLLRFR